MDFQDLRNADIEAVCFELGLSRDPDDKKQFIDDGHRISINGVKWFDHVTQNGGGGAIDLVMHVRNMDFKRAILFLGDIGDNLTIHRAVDSRQDTSRTHTQPPNSCPQNIGIVKAYLAGKRCLDSKLIDWCIDKGLIYADSRFNCVFNYGLLGVELRGTGEKQWRAVYGTIEHCFILPARDAVGVAVTESAIDALSYRQLHKSTITVSIAGNGNHKVINQACVLSKSKNIPVIAAFDNDDGGTIACEILSDYALKHGITLLIDTPELKDWNEQLKKNCKL